MPPVRPFVPQLLPRADLDWKALVPAIGRATWALARYDGILHGVPDPAVLLSPLTSISTRTAPSTSRDCAP